MSTLDTPLYFCTSLAIKKGLVNIDLIFNKNKQNQIVGRIFSFTEKACQDNFANI
jgi:hypothetical protein